MITAFVSMSVAPGSDEDIVKKVINDPIVSEAWLTTGEFDVLLILVAHDAEQVNDYVSKNLRDLEDVIRIVVTFGLESIRRVS
jgi:DNA-binding Lrp family transcriptional regulator